MSLDAHVRALLFTMSVVDLAPQQPQPNVEEGIEYWTTQPASYDGVLGGFGTGVLLSLLLIAPALLIDTTDSHFLG